MPPKKKPIEKPSSVGDIIRRMNPFARAADVLAPEKETPEERKKREEEAKRKRIIQQALIGQKQK